MRIIKALIITAIITALTITITACGSTAGKSGNGDAKGKQTIKIAYLPLTHALPLFVENEVEKVNFKNINVQLIKFGSWPELMDALNTGKVDGASVLIELAMKAKEQGIDLKVAALGHRNGNAIIVSPGINKTEDLKGKTFAVPSKLSTHNVLLYQMLKNAGMSLSDLNVIELPPPEMPAALAEGRVSGYIVAEPFGAKSVANGKGKVLFKDEEIWKNSVCCGLVLRNDLLKNYPAEAQEFVNGYVKAGQYIESSGERVNEISKRYMSVDDNVLQLSLKLVSYNNLRLNENDYKDLSRYLTEMNLSKKPPSYNDFVDNSLIDKAK